MKRIVIGPDDAPILTFTDSEIVSVVEERSVSLIGSEMPVDQLVPTLRYQVYLKGLFVPANYSRFLAADGQAFAPKYNYNLRLLPYGTKIKFYDDEVISGEYFVDTVERLGKDEYKINAMSAIGLMSRQQHRGGVYSGETFADVLSEILGSGYNYTVIDDVAKMKVYGWLPSSTKRRNLHQLIMAYGVNIIKNDAGGMLFTFLAETEPVKIPQSRLFTGGNVKYDAPASRVEVVEHAYHYMAEVEEETLFDNAASGSADISEVTFDHPVYADSLRVTEGNMVITSKGTNFAVVRGNGVLVGKPYIHTMRVISKDNAAAVNEKVVRVEDATLVNLFNSDNVLNRVAQYYFNAETVTGDLVNVDEKCGRRYEITNAFYEHDIAFLTKMSTNATSFLRSSCEFISGYIPLGQGSTYNNVVILAGRGTWTIPPEVFEKDHPNILAVLIGKGHTGAKGEDGEKGWNATTSRGGDGGLGGAGGEGGEGGNVLISPTIDCTGKTSFSYAQVNGEMTLNTGDTTLTTADSTPLDGGYLEPLSGRVFAIKGKRGQSGANGGNGGLYTPTGKLEESTNGEDLTYKGQTWTGGKGHAYAYNYIGDGANIYYGGGGGGGAAVGGNGEDAQLKDPDTGSTESGWSADAAQYGGWGADAREADEAQTVYGAGGNGGHGGGGGGGGAVGVMWNIESKYELMRNGGKGGRGGIGGAGGEGYDGCVIIYY